MINDNIRPDDQILVSHIKRIGILHLQGIEKYLARYNLQRCFLITPVKPHKPHDNVIKYTEQIKSLKIIISPKFKEEKKKIEGKFPDVKIITVDPYHLAGGEGMFDA
jgi:nicotinic acid mononucleotide adenylyltransferase